MFAFPGQAHDSFFKTARTKGGSPICLLSICASRERSLATEFSIIWKPIPVRIFYTFVIYQGYDMDILSGKFYDVIYHRYDMDIANANNLERHILVIFFLTFGQIF